MLNLSKHEGALTVFSSSPFDKLRVRRSDSNTPICFHLIPHQVTSLSMPRVSGETVIGGAAQEHRAGGEQVLEFELGGFPQRTGRV
jgi:hypothetical protein